MGAHFVHCEKQNTFSISVSSERTCGWMTLWYEPIRLSIWSLYLSVRHPIFMGMSGPESQRSRFLLWCLWIQRWVRRQKCPSVALHRLLWCWESRAVWLLLSGVFTRGSLTADTLLAYRGNTSCQTYLKHKPGFTPYQVWMIGRAWGYQSFFFLC